MTIGQELNMSAMGDSCFITLTESTKRIPRFNGKRVHPSTVFRWTKNGIRGVHLDYWRIGRKIVTTEVALNKFFASLALADAEQITQPHYKRTRQKRPSRDRQSSIDEANAVLRNAGILI